MILIVLRIVFGGAFAWVILNEWRAAQLGTEHGDLMAAWFVGLSVILGIANAIVWAPYLGAKLADPLTSPMVKSTFVDRPNYFLRLISWLDHRGCRALTRWLCFIEGIRHPDQPTQFALGLKNTRPGSWLEKIYALEVFKFHNIQNCVAAFHLLQRRGIDPRPHSSPEVNIVLMSLERETRPVRERLLVPPAPLPPRLARNRSIKLFDGAPEPLPEPRPALAEAFARTKETSEAASARESTPPPTWLQRAGSRVWRFIETH